MTDSAAAQPITVSEAGLRRVLATLCLTQITSWGVLFYAFTVLSVRMTQQAGWSPFAVTAAFSAALVTSALVGIVVGRWIDRHGPHAVMTAGSVLGPARPGRGGALAGPRVVRRGLDRRRCGDGRGAVSAGVCGVDPLVRATPRRRADHPYPGRRAGQHRVRAPDRGAGRASALAHHLSRPGRRAGRGHHPGPLLRAAPPLATRHPPAPCGVTHPHHPKPAVHRAHRGDRARRVRVLRDHRQPGAVDGRTRHQHPNRRGRTRPGWCRPGAGPPGLPGPGAAPGCPGPHRGHPGRHRGHHRTARCVHLADRAGDRGGRWPGSPAASSPCCKPPRSPTVGAQHITAISAGSCRRRSR